MCVLEKFLVIECYQRAIVVSQRAIVELWIITLLFLKCTVSLEYDYFTTCVRTHMSGTFAPPRCSYYPPFIIVNFVDSLVTSSAVLIMRFQTSTPCRKCFHDSLTMIMAVSRERFPLDVAVPLKYATYL